MHGDGGCFQRCQQGPGCRTLLRSALPSCTSHARLNSSARNAAHSFFWGARLLYIFVTETQSVHMQLHKPRRHLISHLASANQRRDKDSKVSMLVLGIHASPIDTTGIARALNSHSNHSIEFCFFSRLGLFFFCATTSILFDKTAVSSVNHANFPNGSTLGSIPRHYWWLPWFSPPMLVTTSPTRHHTFCQA